MNTGRYEWLLFDADGTLFDYDAGEKAALARCFAEIGVPFQTRALAAYREINQNLWRALERGEIKPELLKVRRFEMLLNTLGVAHSAAAFSESYLQNLAACAELMPGAEEVLAQLDAHFRIAVVTNGISAVQRGRLERSSIRDFVDHLIISEEVGSAKPAPAFFDEVFARIGHPSKTEALMIGDNWAADIEGAAAYGLDTCWYNPGKSPRPNATAITHEVASLADLRDWLL